MLHNNMPVCVLRHWSKRRLPYGFALWGLSVHNPVFFFTIRVSQDHKDRMDSLDSKDLL